MSTVTNSAITKIAAVTAGLAMFASFALVAPAQAASLSNAQVQSILSLLSSFGANSAVIANVQASLTGGTPSSTTSTTSGTTTSSSCNFTMSLTNGSKGSDVTCLQNALISAGYTIPAGATGYFGNQTKSAVAAWQKATNIAPAVGYFGPISRSHWNLGGTSTTGTVATTGGNTTSGTTALTGNGLKVAVAAGSPNGTVIVEKQGIANLGEFTFSNPTSAAIKVTNLTFNRIGVSNDETLANVYLYNGVNRITDSAGVTNSQFSYSNTAGLFTVPAGSTYTVAVRSDIADKTSGQQIGVQLTSVGSNGTLDSSVSFPIVGGLQTISAATLATVAFQSAALTLPTGTAKISPAADFVVWQNTVSVSKNPVKLSTMTFTNLGSIDASNLQDIRLYVDGTQVGKSVAQMNANRTVTFDMSASPVVLSTASHVIKVLANVTGGSSRTFQFSLQRSSDAMFVDTQLNQPVTTTVGSGAFSAVSAGVRTVADAGTNGVSVTTAAASPTNDIPVGATNVKLASFNFLATGEPVKISNLNVYATASGASTALTNGAIYVNGQQVGSTKDIGLTSATETNFTLGSSLIIPAGTVTTVDVYADAKTSAGNITTGSIQITLGVGSSNGQGQSSLLGVNIPDTNAVAANALAVSSSALTATKFSGYGDQTVVKGTNNARLGAFTLSAGSTEGINVNTIALSLTGNTGVTNLTLKDHATGAVLGSIITSPSPTGNTYSVNLTIPASGTKTIDVYGNVLNLTSPPAVIQATVTKAGTTGTGSITATSAPLNVDQPLQKMTLGNATLTTAVGASNPVNTNVIAGLATSVQVADFTFSAQVSPFTVDKLMLQIPNGVATSTSGITVKYTNAGGTQQTVSQAVALSPTAASTVTFTGLDFIVPKNDQNDVQVWATIPSISNGAVSGAGISVTLMGATGFRATDSASNVTTSVTTGDITSAASNKGTIYVRKSVPSFAMQTLTAKTPVAGQAIYRLNVTADAAGAVDLDQLTFKVSTSTATVSGFKLYDVTGGTVTAISGTVEALVTGIVKIPFTSLQQIGAGQTKTYELRPATVSGWQTGSSVSVSLEQDTAPIANAIGTTLLAGQNTVWSDRSAADHATAGTAAADWTNGNLLKDFVNDVTSFNY